MICYHCKSENVMDGKPGRQQLCISCGSYLHCCRNCRFYDPLAYHACREPQAEWVKEKESGNFCDYFSSADQPTGAGSKAEEARRKLDALFGPKKS
ncbi:MAG: hypothetical protein BWY77_01614 [bacterium ADurb.Bin431]|nr:MAG: hypothetical protein BWY77_01614 [bacterium ADurb.Bin431]